MSSKPGEVSAGRGVVYIAFAKMYFMVAGFAIESALPNLLGRYAFGAYGIVNSWVSTINNVMVTGTIQSVSRYTTADPARADEIKAAGLRMHLLVGLPLAALFAALAPLWAWLENDPGKAGYMALSAGIIAAYALYSVFIGSANGTRAFHKQAGLDMTFATLRAGGILAAAVIGLGVWGAIGAWVGAAAAILVVAATWIGVPRDLRAGDVRPVVRFMAGVALYLIIVNLIMAIDQILLKRLSADWFLAHPAWLEAHGRTADLLGAAHEADGQVGYYRAVQTFARLPYQLMIAVTFVIFPLVSRATFEGDPDKTRSYIRTTMRYSLIFAGLMGAVLAANAAPVLRLVYKPDYALEGAEALAVLALGNVAFSVFTIAGTILNGAGRTVEAVIVSAATLAVLVAGLLIGVPRAAPGRDVLLTCAAATSAAMLIGALASGVLLKRRFGAFLPLLTAVRVIAAIAAVVVVGRRLHFHGPVMTLAGAALGAALFLAVLVATRELSREDLRAVRRVLSRSRGGDS